MTRNTPPPPASAPDDATARTARLGAALRANLARRKAQARARRAAEARDAPADGAPPDAHRAQPDGPAAPAKD